jgi:hypothetical protein
MAESERPPASAARERGSFSPELLDFSQIRPKPVAVRDLASRLVVQCERRNLASRETLGRRVRAEFEEMRGVRLSLPQATRLFGLREDACRRILDGLAADGFLKRMADGRYGRRDVA